MNILVTGGLGYIGSHAVVKLLNLNYEVVVVDNLSNSKLGVVNQIEKIAQQQLNYFIGDIRNKKFLEDIFKDANIDLVMHFAGMKSVNESIEKPLEYYNNNFLGTLNLLSVMKEYKCNIFIFSSSATVYGSNNSMPLDEKSEISTINPYGATKRMIEECLFDLGRSDSSWRIVILRYFNPVGAHPSGEMGEDPNGIPNNLMPYIMKVANNELPFLGIFGSNYKTVDGTGVRDYIHVMDLIEGHVNAIEYLNNNKGVNVFNLGTGRGRSVLELIDSFEKVTCRKVDYQMKARRIGDVGVCYADSSKAKKEMNWVATHTIEDMCKDAWNYYSNKK